MFGQVLYIDKQPHILWDLWDNFHDKKKVHLESLKYEQRLILFLLYLAYNNLFCSFYNFQLVQPKYSSNKYFEKNALNIRLETNMD